MNCLSNALVAGCAVLAIACDGPTRRSPFPQPSPAVVAPDPSPPPPPAPEPIRVGLGETKGHFTGKQVEYEFLPTARGMLTVRLDWPLIDSGLTLRIQGNETGIGYPPIISRVPVQPGQKVTIAVNGGGTDHEYDEHFTLTLTVE